MGERNTFRRRRAAPPGATPRERVPPVCQGEPYSVSRSRKGPASNASGPSTPAPVHTPFASSSSATTGLIAVCHTTACAPCCPHRLLVVDHVVQVDLARVAVRAGAGDPACPRRSCRVICGPRVAGSGRHAATTSRGLTCCAAAPVTGSVLSRPELVQRLQHLDELVAEAVLEGDPLGSRPSAGSAAPPRARRCTHSTGPMPSGKSKTSGSLNGGSGEPAARPSPRPPAGSGTPRSWSRCEKPGAKS